MQSLSSYIVVFSKDLATENMLNILNEIVEQL
jgi:hypothetical protein